MNTKENEKIIVIRLDPKEEILNKIKIASKKHKIKTAVILSGIGQIKNVELGYFKRKGDYSPKKYNQTFELLSLSGNIIKENDEYQIHLHSVLGDENKNTIGGHLIKGEISITAEIFILKTNLEITRKINETTGLKNLYLK